MLATRTLKLTVAVAITGISMASAQIISQQCQTSLAGLVLSSDGQCLNAQGLIGVLAAGQNASLVDPINSWLTGMCAQSACSNDTLATLAGDLSSGCQQDLSQIGFGNVSSGQLTTLLQQVYPTVRQIACLENTKTNTLCVTETLNNLETVIGPFTAAEFQQLVQDVTSGNIPSLPSNVTCTDCTKQAFNVMQQNFPGVLGSNNTSIQQTCGADFTNNQSPTDIKQTASMSSQSSSNNTSDNNTNGGAPAQGIGALGGTVSTLLMALSALVFLG